PLAVAALPGDGSAKPKAGEPVLDGLVSFGCFVVDLPVVPGRQGWGLTGPAGVEVVRKPLLEAAHIISGIGVAGVGLVDGFPGLLSQFAVAARLQDIVGGL